MLYSRLTMTQKPCGKCDDRTDSHSEVCLVSRWVFKKPRKRPSALPAYAMEKAVEALNPYHSLIGSRRTAIQSVNSVHYEFELDPVDAVPSP